ncbi:MAG: hypothetical protein V2J12_02635 [Gammaproteobacteria bacterium]|jgi:hypothetical protein|nr:hypothetical protein [Gammaproteobacteria bacterium]
MVQDDDIPVLTDAVSRRARSALSNEEVDELCDGIAAETWVLVDGLVSDALRDIEEQLRVRINDQLGDQLPALIEKTVREKLGGFRSD